MSESEIGVDGKRQEAIPRIGRKKDSGDGTTWGKKATKTEAEKSSGTREPSGGATKYEVQDVTGWTIIVSAAKTPQPSASG